MGASLWKKILIFSSLYIMTAAIIVSLFVWAPHDANNYPILRAFIIICATVLLTKYFFYMTLSPWYDVSALWRKKHYRRYEPLVSVIVPAWNEEVGILNTVRSLLKTTYPKLEIVVINDGSTDNSHKLMEEFVERYQASPRSDTGPTIKYYYKENGGKGRALNYGISLSSGDIIVTIDGDCVVAPDAIGAFVECFKDPRVMGAVGNVKVANTETILGTLQYLEFLFSFYFKKADSLFNTIYIVGGAAGAFRREVFDIIGPFNPKNITEDIDLSVRMQKAGMPIVYAVNAVVYTEGAVTFEGLLKQRLRWKRGRFQTFYEHRALFLSSNKKHNAILSWLILPLALFGDMQLFFEPFFLLFLYFYSLITHDFSSFISGILVVGTMFVVQLFDDRSEKKLPLFILAPIGWLLFYVTTVVEHHALIQSIRGIVTGKSVEWQRWKRQGIVAKTPSTTR
jgi:biofilm PGA synthesis N-glycosyltransferase PgaC